MPARARECDEPQVSPGKSTKVYGRGTCTYLLSTLTADHWQAITYAFVGARRSHSRSKAKVSEGLYHLRKVRLPIGKSGCANHFAQSCNAWLWLLQKVASGA